MKLRDNKILYLDFHQQRVDEVFRSHYPSYQSLSLRELERSLITPASLSKKCRLLYNHNQYTFEILDYNPIIFNRFYLMDITFTYKFKYYDRIIINHLKMNLPHDSELVFTKNNLIYECSYSNIVLYNGENWVTPSNYLLNGTTRKRLLEEKKIIESKISVEDLIDYKSFKLINALNDFEESKEYNISAILLK